MSQPPPSSASWLASHALETVARVVDAAELERLLASPLVYVGAPRLSADGGVVAALARPGVRGRREHQVSIRGLGGRFAVRCSSCPFDGHAMCNHVALVAADLAISRALRDALLTGGDVAATLVALGEARAEAARAIRASRAVAAWTPPNARGRIDDLDLAITVIDTRRPEHRADYPYTHGTPAVELRARVAGDRAMLDPAGLDRGALRPAHRRLFSLCQPLSRQRKGFVAAGLHASLLVRLLPGLDVRVGETERRVRFSDVRAVLRVVRDRVPLRLARRVVPTAEAERRRPGGSRQDDDEERDVDALVARWTSADGSLDHGANEVVFLSGPHPYVWAPATGTFYETEVDVDAAWAAHLQPAIELVEGHASAIARRIRASLRGRGVVLPSAESLGLSPTERPELAVRIEGTALEPRARLEAAYTAGTFALGEVDATPLDARRDEEVERAAIERLRHAGLVYDDAAHAFVAPDPLAFWTSGISALRADADPPLRVVVPADLARVRVRSELRARLAVDLVSGWLEAKVAFDSEGVEAEMRALRAAIAQKRRWVELSDGTLARIGETVEAFAADAGELADDLGRARLAAHQLGRVQAWVDAADDAAIDAGVLALRAKLSALAVSDEADVPGALAATLRPYQVRGLAWLQFLTALGVGGVLADDMGLGKTLMTIAWLAWRRETSGQMPSLVVCPTSVVGNWAREIERFAPTLRVVVLHGAGREASHAEVSGADVAITSYALLRRDLEKLRATKFRALVLDEAQNVKNADTASRRAARAIDAEQRVALSGTPVENRLGELWSLLDLCNPGMLGSARSFEQRFERPILAEPDGVAARSLRARVRPFVLRRTKRQVLADLPPKQEIDRMCEPSPATQKLYDTLAATLRADLAAKMAADGAPRLGLSMLTALLRLRQMACDPRLIDASRPASLSAKREEFLGIVRELVAEGRRALVFSQFVELLDLWRRDLDHEGIAYEWLDGKTKDRDAVVDRFQRGDAPLFLVSLKAGGSGLNLTAADTVIHCDPWWNPAVEDQATDRAHRIGQERAVTVYRLLARGTVEEKVRLLQSKKRELADAIVRDDAGALRGLSERDVAELLAGIGETCVEDDVETPASLDEVGPPA